MKINVSIAIFLSISSMIHAMEKQEENKNLYTLTKQLGESTIILKFAYLPDNPTSICQAAISTQGKIGKSTSKNSPNLLLISKAQHTITVLNEIEKKSENFFVRQAVWANLCGIANMMLFFSKKNNPNYDNGKSIKDTIGAMNSIWRKNHATFKSNQKEAFNFCKQAYDKFCKTPLIQDSSEADNTKIFLNNLTQQLIQNEPLILAQKIKEHFDNEDWGTDLHYSLALMDALLHDYWNAEVEPPSTLPQNKGWWCTLF